MGPIFNDIDQKRLFMAALLVFVFGIFILGLTYVIPILGILAALFIIGLLIYAVYTILRGRI